MDSIYVRMGRSVKARRQALGWTQEELGEASGLHASYVGQIERGQKKVSLDTLMRLAAALRCTAASLLEEAPPRGAGWSAKIDALLRDKPDREKELLYSTLKHMARQLKGRPKREPAA